MNRERLGVVRLRGMKGIMVADCRFTNNCTLPINGINRMFDTIHERHNLMQTVAASCLQEVGAGQR